jgi:hypothetical protein
VLWTVGSAQNQLDLFRAGEERIAAAEKRGAGPVPSSWYPETAARLVPSSCSSTTAQKGPISLVPARMIVRSADTTEIGAACLCLAVGRGVAQYDSAGTVHLGRRRSVRGPCPMIAYARATAVAAPAQPASGWVHARRPGGGCRHDGARDGIVDRYPGARGPGRHGAEGGLPARCAGDNHRPGLGAGAGVAALGFGPARRVEQARRDWPAPAAVRGDQPYPPAAAAGADSVVKMCLTCRFFDGYAHPGAADPHHCRLVDAPFGHQLLRLRCPEQEPAPALPQTP